MLIPQLSDNILFRNDELEIGSSCKVESQQGTCVLSEKCKSSESDHPSICFFHENHTPVVCCPVDNLRSKDGNEEKDKDIPTLDTLIAALGGRVANGGTPSKPTELSKRKCKEYSKKYSTFEFTAPKPPFRTAILGGIGTYRGEYPFMAAIGREESDGLKFFCGGSLISERYILTAAHCFTRTTPSIIRLGEHNLESDKDNDAVKDYGIEQVIIHPQYRSQTVYNDIALVRLNRTVTFSKFIKPVCLNNKEESDGLGLSAIGWGHTQFGGEPSAILQKVALEIFTNENCAKHFPTTRRIPDGLRKTQICAGSTTQSKDTCQGDSGGPLAFISYDSEHETDIHYLTGITSTGIACGAKLPAIYTRVYSYLPWIEGIAWK
ncbi:serine protease snake-like [Sergentomyia squamirostris]